VKKPQIPPKPLLWVMAHLQEEVRNWPKQVQEDLGHELERVQWNKQPIHFRDMPAIGPGVREIKVVEDATKSQYRTIYIAKFKEAVYVLHVITSKTSEKTSPTDIALAQKRLKALAKWRAQQ
jgi:phage-related protein